MSQVLPAILEEIAQGGPMTFSRFMELALYHPQFGYYERGFGQVGKAGDFYTNVSVGSLFGEMLGFDVARRLQSLDSAEVVILEAGAHDGRLALDVLGYLRQFHPQEFERVKYLIIEPSARRAYRQHELLAAFGKKVGWVKSLPELHHQVQGICISNELLDAFPVHLFKWNSRDQRWIEQLVESKGNELRFVPSVENISARLQTLLPVLPDELKKVLPEGFTVELSPARLEWWEAACQKISKGSLLAVDYGNLSEWFLQPERAEGTIRSYANHRLLKDVLREPGTQDITASVNFSEIMMVGEANGFKTESFAQQGNYLKKLVEQIDAVPNKFPLWTAHRFRQLTSLMHPEHLGRSFKVLVQSKV